MSVSREFREFALDQLERIVPVTSRGMFGGVGIYSGGIFFALIDDDRLFFKVDDSNRGDFEALGMGPFRPFGDDTKPMQYYEVPGDLLEDHERLGPWIEKAVEVAKRAKARGRKGRAG
ncbi:MAG TPA: TfoX/Sxy family protein [Longimicrobiaceae bacterium]|nr:TfoX/Sxy family protein [Longimicrobiaceae bacterium]